MFTKWQARSSVGNSGVITVMNGRGHQSVLGVKSMVSSGNHVTTLQLRAPAEAKKEERRRTRMLSFCGLVCLTSDTSSVVAKFITIKSWNKPKGMDLTIFHLCCLLISTIAGKFLINLLLYLESSWKQAAKMEWSTARTRLRVASNMWKSLPLPKYNNT